MEAATIHSPAVYAAVDQLSVSALGQVAAANWRAVSGDIHKRRKLTMSDAGISNCSTIVRGYRYEAEVQSENYSSCAADVCVDVGWMREHRAFTTAVRSMIAAMLAAGTWIVGS